MPKIDPESLPVVTGTDYPPPFDGDLAGRSYRRIGTAAGLSDFGVNLVTLAPGAWSSQRHWHEGEDELVIVLAGEAVLVEDAGRTLLHPGDCAAFPMNVPDGHHLINESDAPCVFYAIGRSTPRDCHYPDIDLHADGPTDRYFHKDGRPY